MESFFKEYEIKRMNHTEKVIYVLEQLVKIGKIIPKETINTTYTTSYSKKHKEQLIINFTPPDCSIFENLKIPFCKIQVSKFMITLKMDTGLYRFDSQYILHILKQFKKIK